MILKVISNYKMTLFENGIQISTKRWMESLVDMNWSSTQWQCFDFDLDFFLGCLKFVFAFHQRKSGLYPHEEKSCSCKSNIFYLTYLAVSCLAHTRLGEWFIFDWHGPLDVRDLVCWPGPSMRHESYPLRVRSPGALYPIPGTYLQRYRSSRYPFQRYRAFEIMLCY